MANTKIELLLALKDRYSAALKRADKDTETATQRMKRKLGEVKERFSEAADAVKRNTAATFTDIHRYITDSSYRRASILVAMRDLKDKINGVKTAAKNAFDELRSNVPILDKAITLMSNPITLGVTGVVAIGGALKNAADLAMDWQKGMAEINVTAGLSQAELEKLSSTMLDIGTRNVAPLEEVPTAFNKIISAGLDAKTALASLDPTLQAAKAGFVDIETVAKAGVNVMNSAGVKDIVAETDILDATGKVITKKGEVIKTAIEQVYDTLFATMQKGAASMSEIAAYLPTIVPTAKNAGVSLEQASGAFAFMTAQGVNAASAATLLNGAFNSLSNPKLLGNFKAIGVEIYDAKGNMRSMPDIVNDLAKSLNGLSDSAKAQKLASLGLDQTSAQAFAVMTQSADKFRDTLDATANSSGALKESYNNSMTAADQWGIALNNIKAVAIKIGQAFLPIITKVGEWAAAITSGIIPAIKGAVEWCKEWWPVLATLAVGFVAMNANNIVATASLIAHSVATKACAAAQWLLNAAMSANPIGLVVMAIAALVAMVTIAIKKYDEWGAAMLLLMGPIGMIVNLVMTIKRYWDSIVDAFTNGGFIEGIKQIGRALLDLILYPVQQLLELLSKIPGLGRLAAKGFDFIKEMRTNLNMIDPEKKTQSAQSETDETEDKSLVEQGMEMLGFGNGGLTGDGSGSGGGSGTGTADSIAGSAKQIKNITVNIDAFNKGGINAGNTQGLNGKSAVDIEEWFTQMLLRTVRNLEMTY